MFYKVTHGRYVSLLLGGLGIYVLWMDVGFYLELQNLPVRQQNISSVYTYSPYHPLTVKLLMTHPLIQYIDEPLGHLTVRTTRLADYVTPNMVCFVFTLLSEREI